MLYNPEKCNMYKIRVLSITRRNALRSQSEREKFGSASAVSPTKDIAELKANISEYLLGHINNMKENGLFFNLLLRLIYLMQSVWQHSVWEIKEMKAKDNVIASICTSAHSLKKISLDIICKSQKLSWFWVCEPHVTYLSQKTPESGFQMVAI